MNNVNVFNIFNISLRNAYKIDKKEGKETNKSTFHFFYRIDIQTIKSKNLMFYALSNKEVIK